MYLRNTAQLLLPSEMAHALWSVFLSKYIHFLSIKKKKEEEEIAALEQWGKWINRIKSGWRKACCKLVFFYFINSIVKAMVFPVVMYGYASWTIKRAEH